VSVTICPKTGRGQTEVLYYLLDSIGPMSTVELVRLTGRDREKVNESLRLLRRSTPKRIHIARYERQQNTGGRCIPIYAVGDLPDAPELPGLSHKVRNEMYRERHRARIRARTEVRRGNQPNIWKGLMQ
jgi:hypothetical protein